MQNKEWLTLSEYSTKYKVSVSTLRRRIKSKKVNCIYEDGKYFLRNLPLSGHRFNNTKGDLTHHQINTPKATTAPPQISSGSFEQEYTNRLVIETEAPETQQRLQLEIEDHLKPRQSTKQTGVTDDVKFMVKELKNAYTLNLKEKEEQILILKDEITDLKMLVHALEGQLDSIKSSTEKVSVQPTDQLEKLNPQPIELEYIPTPNIELANDWLEDDL